MSTFAVFLSFSFLFHFYIFTKLYTYGPLWRNFLCISTLLYITNSFSICIGTLSLHITRSNPIYIQRSFSFFSNAHLWFIQKFFLYILVHTHKNPSIRIFYKNPSMHIFLFLYIRRHFIHYTSLFFIMILVHFIFRKTFLNEKFYAIPEFLQTLLTTTKQVLT